MQQYSNFKSQHSAAPTKQHLQMMHCIRNVYVFYQELKFLKNHTKNLIQQYINNHYKHAQLAAIHRNVQICVYICLSRDIFFFLSNIEIVQVKHSACFYPQGASCLHRQHRLEQIPRREKLNKGKYGTKAELHLIMSQKTKEAKMSEQIESSWDEKEKKMGTVTQGKTTEKVNKTT